MFGLSYKENSDDLRGSPAFLIFKRLKIKFKEVNSFDPNIDVNHLKKKYITYFLRQILLLN